MEDKHICTLFVVISVILPSFYYYVVLVNFFMLQNTKALVVYVLLNILLQCMNALDTTYVL